MKMQKKLNYSRFKKKNILLRELNLPAEKDLIFFLTQLQ